MTREKLAIDNGVDLLMVDTGRIEQLFQALDLLSKKGIEDRFQVSFSGGITVKLRIPTAMQYASLDKMTSKKEIDVDGCEKDCTEAI